MGGEKIIYADGLFMLNFCVDGLALLSGGRISGVSFKWFYILLAAAVGGAYSVAAAYFELNGAMSIAVELAVALLMCYIAFDIRSIRSLVGATLSFYASNLLFGGCVTALLRFLRDGGSIPKPIVIVSASCAVFLAVRFAVERQKERRSRNEVDCTVSLCGETKRLRLLYDSGNLLCDPFCGRKVIVLSGNAFSDIKEMIESGNLSPLISAKPRIIPISTAGGNTQCCGILYGFLPDSVILHNGKNGDVSVTATVAIDCSATDFGGTDGVMPTAIT